MAGLSKEDEVVYIATTTTNNNNRNETKNHHKHVHHKHCQTSYHNVPQPTTSAISDDPILQTICMKGNLLLNAGYNPATDEFNEAHGEIQYTINNLNQFKTYGSMKVGLGMLKNENNEDDVCDICKKERVLFDYKNSWICKECFTQRQQQVQFVFFIHYIHIHVIYIYHPMFIEKSIHTITNE